MLVNITDIIRTKETANMSDRLAVALTFAHQLSETYGDLPAAKYGRRKAKVPARRHKVAIAYKRMRAETGCEVCGWSLGPDNWEALHAHHVIPLACGGSDAFDNLIALCPNHHTMAHRVGRRDYWRWTGPRSKGQLLAVLKA
jgi:5-methylcytosine-specific restriction endonuclease McrA